MATRATENSGTALAEGAFVAPPVARSKDRSVRSSLFIALVLVPLISYAILATVAVVILYMRPQPHPLEFLPDFEGDFKGAKHQKQVSISYERVQPDVELPERLRLRLGQSLRLDDLEVTANRVELVRIPGRSDDSLALHLAFQNVSQDTVFSPTDPYFDRAWKQNQGSKPYTFLQLGEFRLYGGPLSWRPGLPEEARPKLEGQSYRYLRPGEKLESVVYTNPEDHVRRLLADYRGPLIWRVQVRRGLVHLDEREVSATSVVGVEFSDANINKSVVPEPAGKG